MSDWRDRYVLERFYGRTRLGAAWQAWRRRARSRQGDQP